MSLHIANKYKKEWNKPKGTKVMRIPQGIEDSLFISYFSGWYKNTETEYGKDKIDIDLKVKSKQDMAKVAN